MFFVRHGALCRLRKERPPSFQRHVLRLSLASRRVVRVRFVVCYALATMSVPRTSFLSTRAIYLIMWTGHGYLNLFGCCSWAFIVSKYAYSMGERVLLNLSEFPTSHSVLSGCSEFPNYHIFVQFSVLKNMLDMFTDVRFTGLV